MAKDRSATRTEELFLTRRIRCILALFVLGLVLSGLTAFPLDWEVTVLREWTGPGTLAGRVWPGMSQWMARVYEGLNHAGTNYPFLLYGTDWLAFAHLVIAIAFWGPLRDPVRNIWVIEFGMVACILVIPLALICGPLRGIPFFWRLIDCSFGVVGILPLGLAHHYTRRLAMLQKKTERAIETASRLQSLPIRSKREPGEA